MKIKIPNLKTVAKKIGIADFEEWKGACYAIAVKMVESKAVSGVAKYGHFLGKIHSESMFYKNSGIGFVRHGWVLLLDGRICDPTRWVFECKEPYIYVGDNNGEYDIGGNGFRDALRKPPPPCNPKDKPVNTKTLSPAALEHVYTLLEHPACATKHHMFWLANLSPKHLQPYAVEIYTWFEQTDVSAFVPIDNWKEIMEN